MLVGLKAAHDQLAAKITLDAPMVGRDSECEAILSFVSSEGKRILPVVGQAGIGKSRMLYESLALLSEDDWRILWGLPETMKKSTNWFRFLNSPKRTCLAIDDSSSPELLREVVEQLVATGRRNWKVIFSCRTEQKTMLYPLLMDDRIEEALLLKPLENDSSLELLSAYLGTEVEKSWAYSIHQETGGIPAWLCLIAELIKRNSLSDLPRTTEAIANSYIDSCLQSLESSQREQGKILLRWIALWGTLRIDESDETRTRLQFLEEQGLNQSLLHVILKQLLSSGLVINWGGQQRQHAVQPNIIREHILSSWLLEEADGKFAVSVAGREFVKRLLTSNFPDPTQALQSLSRLASSRLSNKQAFSFTTINKRSRLKKEEFYEKIH